ncbi:hypothetical protein M9458_021189 [Cirrhinus mrigala]|uniref:Transposase element L1Md-A101/L1Md-A102/L1Md-A2 n=1 Tax=Cirrhinus mrigala TaxID=683832 RepID=A0ABD0QH40_CIRMR
MATNLRKFQYTGAANTRPNTAGSHTATNTAARASPPQLRSANAKPEMDAKSLKSEILLSLKTEISAVIKSEMKNTLADDFDFLKNELQALKAEVKNNTAAIHSEIDQVKTTVRDMETGLSAWSDEVVTLRNTVNSLKTEVAELRDKCEDMEGRARRCNIRILGVPETPGSNSTTSVSKLLREALQLDKDVLIDRSHRSLAPRKPGGKPRAIVAKLHYYQDCVEVLNRARTRAPLRYDGESIAILPDYTTRVAKARAAFTEVRKLLHNRQNVRFGILFPARLRVTHNGEEKEFTDAEKAMTYVRNHIIPAEEFVFPTILTVLHPFSSV